MTGCMNARLQMAHGASLTAVSSAYPSQVVGNGEYLERAAFEPADGWSGISAESGIRARRWCSSGENSATLMRAALAQLMEEHPQAVAEVDAVVVASGTTMPVVLPISDVNPAAADLAPLALRQLGATEALGLDLKACYCTGFLRGLEVADGLLASPNRRAVLVVAVEQGSKLATAASNRSSFSFMVGDAAGAAILGKCEKQAGRGLLDYAGYTDHRRLEWVGVGPDARSIIMMGSKAAAASVELFVRMGQTLLERNHLTSEDVTWLLPLQTHRGLVHEVAARLDWPRDRVLWDAAELGFSGSSSIPACLADKLRAKVVARGDLVLALAVGAGLNCAGALFYC
jgi:3-oxoacyl-[acyl-carrier-protein] synthase-3